MKLYISTLVCKYVDLLKLYRLDNFQVYCELNDFNDLSVERLNYIDIIIYIPINFPWEKNSQIYIECTELLFCARTTLTVN